MVYTDNTKDEEGNTKVYASVFKPDAEPLDVGRIEGYLDQIVAEDWHKFEPGDYHEINPRSMSNFFRALSWLKNRKAISDEDKRSIAASVIQHHYKEYKAMLNLHEDKLRQLDIRILKTKF